MDIWIFLNVIAVGPVKECKKLLDALQSESFKSHRPDNVFVNFDVKNSEIISDGNTKDEHETNLQRICAEKVLSLYDENKLQLSDINTMPVELLQKIVNCIPFTVPATEADVVVDNWGKHVQPAVKLNFNKIDMFVKKINELRPDLPSNWAEEAKNRPGMIMYSHNRSALQFTDPGRLLQKYLDYGVDLTVIGRVSCDWDGLASNNFTKIFVIENNKVAFLRKDLPKSILADDHAMIKKYGHLLQEWQEIHEEARLEFDTKEFGTFKLLTTSRRVK